MKAREFYGHFAAAYGTCWLVVMVVAVITQQYIETGPMGLYGFPILGICYALFRNRPAADEHRRMDDVAERLSRLEAQQAAAQRGPAVS